MVVAWGTELVFSSPLGGGVPIIFQAIFITKWQPALEL